MADTFYPFVGEGSTDSREFPDMVENPARIAVFDDPAAAPRVVVVQPKDVRSYLEEVTATVTRLAKEQGGSIPFTVIREVVENLVHAYFSEPTITILDGGDTIRFSDQGPGIKEKDKALEYGTTSATEQMKRYIRGVGSGLPYVQQYLLDHGGDITIEDNMNAGTIVTITMAGKDDEAVSGAAYQQALAQQQVAGQAVAPQPAMPGAQQAAVPAPMQPAVQPQQAGQPQQIAPTGYPAYAQAPLPPGYQQVAPMPQPMPYAAPGYPAAYPQAAYPQVPAYQQPAAPMAAGYQQQAPQQAGTWPPDITVTERGRLALGYLAQHESVGPTELAQLYGSSMSTWTRELKRLEDQGLVRRVGQKRFLTEVGRRFL